MYVAQTKGDNSELVEVFKKCQKRLDNKLERYNKMIEEINSECRTIEKEETIESDLTLEELQALLNERQIDNDFGLDEPEC